MLIWLAGCADPVVTVELTADATTRPVLHGDDLGGSWEAEVEPDFVLTDGTTTVELDELVATWTEPAVLQLVALVDGDEAANVPILALGREVVWGDLHAHSNLSHDGCEEVDEDCADREAYAGAGFFDEARERGLDFAALTDHAEYATYHPDGDPLSEGIDIWQAQQDLVQAADDPDFVPLLGYEWTLAKPMEVDEDGHFEGGHKTIILGEPTACAEYRIAAPHETGVHEKASGSGPIAIGRDDELDGGVPHALWELLDAAKESCGEQPVMGFAHHPAWSLPQATDFTRDINIPDGRYEWLVEVLSEHGSSECADPGAEGCDWWPKTNAEYRTQGAVQTALQQGYRLGFVAGTDSHDARPGSVEDDPSCTAMFEDEDGDDIPETPRCHDWHGALTGALVDELGREQLFEAFQARRTVITSGPMAAVRASMVVDGRLYAPGDQVPPGTASIRAWAPLEGTVQLLAASGEVVAEGEQALEADLAVADGEVFYVRVRVDGEPEERLWASPWFVTE